MLQAKFCLLSSRSKKLITQEVFAASKAMKELTGDALVELCGNISEFQAVTKEFLDKLARLEVFLPQKGGSTSESGG